MSMDLKLKAKTKVYLHFLWRTMIRSPYLLGDSGEKLCCTTLDVVDCQRGTVQRQNLIVFGTKHSVLYAERISNGTAFEFNNISIIGIKKLVWME
jgi:hypothetical protein